MSLNKVLLVCTGNSCRSQMAHGFLSSYSKKVSVYSAGTKPEAVNRHAVEVMSRVGRNISDYSSNSVQDYLNEEFDFIIFLCKNAKKISPALKSVNTQILKKFVDPANAKGTEKEIIEVYTAVRDELELFMQDFFNKNLNK
jgi:arsenate reductase|tara:strand:+ start:89 stop:511 length:423 start_codon:yes stop_codon:yes gene_type:complete